MALVVTGVGIVLFTELDLILVWDFEKGNIICLICSSVSIIVLMLWKILILPLPLLRSLEVTSGVAEVFLESALILLGDSTSGFLNRWKLVWVLNTSSEHLICRWRRIS